MTDPAIDAARRAEHASGWWKSGYSTPWDHDYATDAAREALTPIRDLLDAWEETGHLDYEKLRALVYTSDEIAAAAVPSNRKANQP